MPETNDIPHLRRLDKEELVDKLTEENKELKIKLTRPKKLKDTKGQEGEFTKRFRKFIKLSEDHLSKGKIGRLQTYGKEACDIIDRQAAKTKELQVANEDLYGELDAECRVSQMLLAELKKFKDKQDAE